MLKKLVPQKIQLIPTQEIVDTLRRMWREAIETEPIVTLDIEAIKKEARAQFERRPKNGHSHIKPPMTPLSPICLMDIWATLAVDDVDAADRMLDLLHEKIDMLAEYPKQGLARSDIEPGMRMLPVDQYVLLYCEQPTGGIELIRIVHANNNFDQMIESF